MAEGHTTLHQKQIIKLFVKNLKNENRRFAG